MSHGSYPPARPALRAGLLPSRRLISRKPGAGGPASLLIGAGIVILSLTIFLKGTQTERTTFDFDPVTFTANWNAAVDATDRPVLALASPRLRSEAGSDDTTFTTRWTETLYVRGRVDPSSGKMVEVSVIGDPAADDAALVASAMDLLVAATEPSLTTDERIDVLQELGLVGGGSDADGAATRGDTDYVVGRHPDTGVIGLGAAPHSTLTSRLKK
jgi:hypothetical protein